MRPINLNNLPSVGCKSRLNDGKHLYLLEVTGAFKQNGGVLNGLGNNLVLKLIEHDGHLSGS